MIPKFQNQVTVAEETIESSEPSFSAKSPNFGAQQD